MAAIVVARSAAGGRYKKIQHFYENAETFSQNDEKKLTKPTILKMLKEV
jgi:hypothetical protein